MYRFKECLTIQNHDAPPAADPQLSESGISLMALTWILQDERRANRFLDLTGLTPNQLRAGLEDPAVHRAIRDFLCAHEPDLLAASEALGVSPRVLTGSRQEWPE